MSGQDQSAPSTTLPDAAAPAGQGDWIVEDGQTIDSIADATGFFWQTLWDLPGNAALKQARPNRTVLAVGDRVTIPDLRHKQETRTTDLVHRFRRKGVPAEVRFRVLDADFKPMAGRSYLLRVGHRSYQGTTDGDGRLHHFVAPAAAEAELILPPDPKTGASRRRWMLQVGTVRPSDSLEGVRNRLSNLGFETGPDTGAISERLRDALRAFQGTESLEQTGEADDATLAKLRERHGS